MTSKVEFPIRRKLFLVISGLVLVSTAAYLSLAIKLFKDDKTSVVYELNAGNVKTLAAETEASLQKTVDKVKLLTKGHRDQEWTRAVFETDPDLISFSLYQPTTEEPGWKQVTTVRNSDYLKLYGLSAETVEKVREAHPIPFARILSNRSWVGNSTVPGGAPIMTLGLAVEVRDEAGSQTDAVAVADLRLDHLLKSVSSQSVATTFIVDSEGRLLAHPDTQLVASSPSMGDVPIVADAVQRSLPFQLKRYEWKGQPWLGAYATVGVGGLSAISQVEEARAFQAARKLLEKSLLFALIVITAALLITLWVSQSFTEPLQKLLAATERLSRWEFGDSIFVKTRDEIAHLARTFNAMTTSLRNQREQLEQNRAELELKVKERTQTLEVQKQQLTEAQDALLRTTRLASVGELAGAAAHEVLNPLNNMNIRLEKIRRQATEGDKADAKLLNEIISAWKIAYSEGGWQKLSEELQKPAQGQHKTLIEEDLANLGSLGEDTAKRLSAREEDFEFLSKEITRITRILNNMRGLSRVGGERKALDVHVPIEETSLTLADILDKRKVTLIKEFGSELRERYSVTADKDELVQVFSNLVRNALSAIDSAKRRAGTVKISTRRQGDRVEIRISDNGTGIKPEHLPRIFEPDFTTKSVEEGTGIGLSISRRLVRAFGGDIEVESVQEGQGTTFLIWLPATS